MSAALTTALRTVLPHWAQRLLRQAFAAMQGGLALASLYQLALLASARRGAREPTAATTEGEPSSFVVLMPAHDEEGGIEAALRSLLACEYPRERLRPVVIADNCTDSTADRARRAGAEVWERTEPAKRGKGYALAWALERLWRLQQPIDAVVVLDADCLVSPNMLAAMDRALRGGAPAVQVSYLVDNPGESHASALRFAAFALIATVRPLGKQRLGLSCGLFGTGMAFRSDLLRSEPWSPTALVEDFDYHLRLVAAGQRVQFLPEAWVRSAMPASFAGSNQQQARWEKGKLQVIRRWSPRLIASGLARGDLNRAHAGFEQLIPPQSLIAAGSLACMGAGLALRSARLLALAGCTLAAQLTFVVAGLRLVGAPAQVYRALLAAPILIAGKLALYARLLAGGGPASWVRTER
jgi:1,2-diacylglycerol 3-beta-glucosyltransferase